VLLTGMGKDGAVELKRMMDAGHTIAQERSCRAGMPGEASSWGSIHLPRTRSQPPSRQVGAGAVN